MNARFTPAGGVPDMQSSGTPIYRTARQFHLKTYSSLLLASLLLTVCLNAQTTTQDSSSSQDSSSQSSSSSSSLPDEPVAANSTQAAAAPQPAKEPTPAEMGAIYRGQILMQPPDSQRLFGPWNNVRNAMQRHGFGIYAISQTVFIYNTLSAPVPYNQIHYPGQRPFIQSSSYPGLTYDMRAFGLKNAQFAMIAAIQKMSWNPAGPEAVGFGGISYYQSVWKNRLEFKGGYLDEADEFIQLKVGGLANNGALGVYAVLPYEVGLANLPQQAPAFNVRANLPHHFYAKVGFQRSFSNKGGVGEQARDKLQLRFAPKGDGLLSIFEGDYQQSTYKNPMKTWVRAGFMYNTTKYTNFKTGRTDTTNYGTYLIADRQFTHTSATNERRGLYAGFSAMYVPPSVNKYTQYYEFRLYDNGPISKRPSDFASLVFSHTDNSEFYTRTQVAQGKRVWNSAWSATGTYTTKLYRGAYWVNALGYTQGPSITPRTRNALEYNTMLMLFF
ncbi:MAG TPA: carbohydrate porin [Acidisarcina sp.]|nr:carbohydrate porin [Acidisarcina sp.]